MALTVAYPADAMTEARGRGERWLPALLILAAGTALSLSPLPFDDATTIRNTVSIRERPDVVFTYVATPANWPRWHPSSLAVSGMVDHSLTRGEQAIEDFLVAGHRGRAVWRVLARDAPRRWMIDGEVDGRRGGVVTYRLAPEEGGTRFEREFVYPSPNLIFSILNRLRLRARIEAESAEAVRRLKQVLEATS